MANLSKQYFNSISYGTAQYPVHMQEASGLLRRAEPLVTPEQLISRFLIGIPLVMLNGDVFTPANIKDRINLAVNEAELLLGMNITREQYREKTGFDWNLYRAYIHTRTQHKPIVSLESMAIVSASQQAIFTIPAQWIETSKFAQGLIFTIPLLAAFGTSSVVAGGEAVGPGASGNFSAGGIAFLSTLGGNDKVPAYFEIVYTAGLSNNEHEMPLPVNELIGCIAAIDILSSIASTYLFTSQSQSQDGISQSSTSPGNRIYLLRIAELEKRRDSLIAKIKGIFGTKFWIGNI